MREKIIEIIKNSMQYKDEDVADQIISTLIESLPEEMDNLGDVVITYVQGVKDGRNSYRNEVINLLRGTK